MPEPFCLRIRFGQFEVEVSGARDEVLETVRDLRGIVSVVSEAFAQVQAGMDVPAVSTASNVTGVASARVVYPSIQSSGSCSDAVLRLLSTEWGRSTPRTLPELVDAMKANAVHYPATTLSGVLNWLVKRGRVKRWRTDRGYVYVLVGSSAAADDVVVVQGEVSGEASVARSGGVV